MFVLFSSDPAFAAHPLITDDTGTQGKGEVQFEFISEYSKDVDDGGTEQGVECPTIPVFSFGITHEIDIVFGLPYVSVRREEAGTTTAVRGVSDASVELKARFYERGGLSVAIRPGISLPTGDEEMGLGNGKPSYRAFFITTKKVERFAFHFNTGYIRNDYKLQADQEASRKDIWHVSLASQIVVVKDLNLVTNIGMERNVDKRTNTHPAFILGGLIYSAFENLDIDIGLKAGLNKAETDYSLLTGITWRL